MADVDAICCVWGTDSEDECEGAKVVADSAGAGGGSLFGMELVQIEGKGNDLGSRGERVKG